MKKILLSCFFWISLQATEQSRQDYLQLIKEHPALVSYRGDAKKGEIEILTDRQKMADIEASTKRDVGLIKKDKYWIWLNDAVCFPSGFEGVYSRVLWVRELENQVTGVCVMPVLADGKVVVNCNFRHATRSWEIELPRGGLNTGETAEIAARRETMEETGKEIQELTLLGNMPPDSGALTTVVPVYLAQVVSDQKSSPEETEAIEEVLALSISELEKALERGYYDYTIRGEVKQVHCRDPFLTYALFMYKLKTSQ